MAARGPSLAVAAAPPSSPLLTEMSFATVQASAPGKIILAGEHAVVHGTRALATVIDKRMHATLSYHAAHPDTVTLRFQDASSPASSPASYSWPLDRLAAITSLHISSVFPSSSSSSSTEPDRAALDATHPSFSSLLPQSERPSPFDASCQVFLLFFCFLFRSRCGVVCELSSELPISAGLGSSASFCTALAAVFHAVTDLLPCASSSSPQLPLSSSSLSLLNSWAYEGERLLHGTPSGVDNTCSVYGGVVCCQRGQPIQHLPRLPGMRWLLVNTRVARDTKALVAGVREKVETQRDLYWPVVQSIDRIVSDFIALLSSPPPSASDSDSLSSRLSPLIRRNQELLSVLGVSHPAIAAVIAVTDAEHGCPSKLTGAGGGGCVLVLLRDDMHETEVKEMEKQLQDLGYDCLQAAVGQQGVQVRRLDIS